MSAWLDMGHVLDMSFVEELLSLTADRDPELLLDLIEMFLGDAPGKVRAVREGIAKGDFDLVEGAAHSLKGSSGNLGAHRLQATCELLQQACRTNDTRRVEGLVATAEEDLQAAMEALQGLQSRYSS
jgi:HPt (histidine-containing phosphotransfer) domain-containing protein